MRFWTAQRELTTPTIAEAEDVEGSRPRRIGHMFVKVFIQY